MINQNLNAKCKNHLFKSSRGAFCSGRAELNESRKTTRSFSALTATKIFIYLFIYPPVVLTLRDRHTYHKNKQLKIYIYKKIIIVIIIIK